jgi:membrane protein required for colicin V production
VNMLDVILLAIVAWNVITGFMAGLARVGIGLAASLLGILLGFWFYYIPAQFFREYLGSAASNLLGFFVVFAVCVLAGAIVARVASRALKLVGLSFLDRLGGAAFGVLRGAVIAVAVVTVITAFSPAPPPRFIVQSRVMPYAARAARVMSWLAPRSIKDAYRETLDKLHRIWTDQKRKVIEGESV